MTDPDEIIVKLYGFEITLPGGLAKEITAKWAYFRKMNLSELKIDNGNCCWCNERPIPSSRHRYCSTLCRDSAYLFCYPQSPVSKGYLLMKQHWACLSCGLCYDDQVKIAIIVKTEHRPDECDPISAFYWIGYKIGQEMDMDHIKPIYKGGVGLGFNNHQVICRPCHHRKTAIDRQRRIN